MAPKRKADIGGSSADASKKAALEPVDTLVSPKRVRILKDGDIGSGPVIYWMSRDQRVQDNWALLHAAEVAAKSRAPVAVVFNLVPSYLNAGARQFGFMLRGLKLMQPKLEALNIPFFLVKGDPVQTVPELVEKTGASLLVTDFASLRLGRQWRDQVAEKLSIPFHEVDAHNVVPCWLASDKREYGARTIRPKIHRQLPEFLQPYPELEKQPKWELDVKPDAVDWDAEIADVVERGKHVPEVDWVQPGEDAAMEALLGEKGFLTKERLSIYHTKRNDPNCNALSQLSPFLHFGHLSPQRAALEASKLRSKFKEGVEAFLEEAVVRRELSDNYCFYTPNYDTLDACYPWARETLQKHASDKREYIYTQQELEEGKTHDLLWNAAQLEMVHSGKMHGFMRMYWAKKILEWTNSPEEALEIAIVLNDKWEIDGRDPNGYVGCMWSIGGIHDQGWGERPVFGKIRYMNAKGCQRKFDCKAYIKLIDDMMAKVKAKKNR
ncbi:Deoxyribodipyrimidine photo-lyase [Coccomyxa sp. Obi]|nr:Deoxyribodipyrimidine photo-lyase [Coccomyxa sp. Obi]